MTFCPVEMKRDFEAIQTLDIFGGYVFEWRLWVRPLLEFPLMEWKFFLKTKKRW